MQWANEVRLEKCYRQRTENIEKRDNGETNYGGPSNCCTNGTPVKQANWGIGELMHNYIGTTIYLVICSLNLTIQLDIDIIGTTHRKIKSA